ncbi:hypothetical protein [Delftia sp. PE138]|uniref:hypothetical protein n=1 Tax=Delftia sp. PE138 TaxID=1812483 RepID=UPI001BB0AB00|nr:hypothetical protein [Delftia sp. PE138]MBS3721840.1 hypothetical protein [Delftia sp. PE138]
MNQPIPVASLDEAANLSVASDGVNKIASAVASAGLAESQVTPASPASFEELNLQEAAGNFGDTYEASVSGPGRVWVRTEQITSIALSVLRRRPADEIALLGKGKLVVYERRTPKHCVSSRSGLRLELGDGASVLMTKNAAYELARVLIAYASPDNARSDWLILKES